MDLYRGAKACLGPMDRLGTTAVKTAVRPAASKVGSACIWEQSEGAVQRSFTLSLRCGSYGRSGPDIGQGSGVLKHPQIMCTHLSDFMKRSSDLAR